MDLSETKAYKMWFIKEICDGADYEVKKVAENSQDFIAFNPDTNKVTTKSGENIDVFKTFKEAAMVTIGKKITKKKELWDALIEQSYKLNEEIGNLIEKRDQLKGISDGKPN